MKADRWDTIPNNNYDAGEKRLIDGCNVSSVIYIPDPSGGVVLMRSLKSERAEQRARDEEVRATLEGKQKSDVNRRDGMSIIEDEEKVFVRPGSLG